MGKAWKNRGDIGQVLAAPVNVVAGDDELNTFKSVDEVPHCVCEVTFVRSRVTELDFVGIQYVTSTHVDADTHVTADPTRRPRVGQDRFGEMTNFRAESKVLTQPVFNVESIFPTLKESVQKDGFVTCFLGIAAVDLQFLKAMVVSQGPIFAEHIARTQIIEAFDLDVKNLVQTEYVVKFKNSRLAASDTGDVFHCCEVEHLVAESATVSKTTVKTDVSVDVTLVGGLRRPR